MKWNVTHKFHINYPEYPKPNAQYIAKFIFTVSFESSFAIAFDLLGKVVKVAIFAAQNLHKTMPIEGVSTLKTWNRAAVIHLQ